jgi:REP element-mobilizing transposase RayT
VSADDQDPARTRALHGDPPLAYFITFRSYGTWLPGDERGWVDLNHNVFGTPYRPPSSSRQVTAENRLRHAAIDFRAEERSAVDRAIRRVCEHRHWPLHAVNVRSNHVHVVVSGGTPPEHIMNALKSWGTRSLGEANLRAAGTKVWARHGSNRYLWDEGAVEAACNYVVHGQDKSGPGGPGT